MMEAMLQPPLSLPASTAGPWFPPTGPMPTPWATPFTGGGLGPGLLPPSPPAVRQPPVGASFPMQAPGPSAYAPASTPASAQSPTSPMQAPGPSASAQAPTSPTPMSSGARLQLETLARAIGAMLQGGVPPAPSPMIPQAITPGDPLAVVSRDAEKILVPSLPPTAGYETWRFQTSAAVLAASAKPAACLQWLHQVQDQSIPYAQLAVCEPQFQSLDCRLFTGLLSCLGGKSATNAEQEIALMARTRCSLGCGRQLLRLIDLEYRRDTAGRRQRALKTLLSLRPCTAKEHLEPRVLQIDTLLSELRGSSEFPTNDMLCVVIRKAFSQVALLSALFAAADLQGWLQAGVGRPLNVLEAIRKIILDGRDEATSSKDFAPKQSDKQTDKHKGMAADASSAKGKGKDKIAGENNNKGKDKSTGKDNNNNKDKNTDKGKANLKDSGKDNNNTDPATKTCSFCGKTGHELSQCWFDPKSSNYRGPKSSSGSGSSATGPSSSTSAAPLSGAAAPKATPQELAATFFSHLAGQLSGGKGFAGPAHEATPEHDGPLFLSVRLVSPARSSLTPGHRSTWYHEAKSRLALSLSRRR